MPTHDPGSIVLGTAFLNCQLLYLITFLIDGYFFTLPVNWVDMAAPRPATLPRIVLFYPVLHELETTMRTTLRALGELDYPRDRFEVIAIPNASDEFTVVALQKLQGEFPFLKLIEVPATDDPRWRVVWDAWDRNPAVYWWHRGRHAHDRDLPPKKTRQLIYAFYTAARERTDDEDFLVNYIDADSAPPRDHFMAGAIGMQHYDVLQSTNIAGNLLASTPASFHAFDHMAWDGRKYPHMSANGRHPYWVLGKGLFFRASDLIELGGFHPWVAIEDPEVGMRFWKAGRRLGIIRAPLIEEVPDTFADGIKQRKRWVAGFWESLTGPLTEMGFTRGEKFRAWLNFLPCTSLWINVLGLPLGIWAGWEFLDGSGVLPRWSLVLAAINLTLWALSLLGTYWATWQRTKLVLPTRRQRLVYLLRVNPLFVWFFWIVWLIPLWIGWRMYRRESSLVWERTRKIDANADLVQARIAAEHDTGYGATARSDHAAPHPAGGIG